MNIVAKLRSDARTRVAALAGLTLMLELALIRWLPANVFHLGFFTNFVLLGCFLGIGLGFLLARHERNLFSYGPFVLFGVVATAFILSPEVHVPVSGATEVFVATADVERSVVPPEVFLFLLFAGIAATFTCISQATGRAFQELEALSAYNWDIIGSLVGIVVFTVLSALWAPSAVWFAVLAVVWVLLLLADKQPTGSVRPALLALVAAVAISTTPDTLIHADRVIWSPYHMLNLFHVEGGSTVTANRLPFQALQKVDKSPYRRVPYEHARKAGKTQLRRILIVGAGSGSDVAVALDEGVEEITAAELDPAVQRLGVEYHPEHPYDSDRVTVVIGDARQALQLSNDNEYDAVIFAMPDSLALLSTQSSLRLESFLFTRESFQSVRRILKPDGIFAMYNYYRDPNLISRLAALAEEVFGDAPIVDISDEVVSNDRGTVASLFGVITVGGGIRGEGYPPEDPTVVESLPEDDWPFLYLMKREVPRFYLLPLILLLLLTVGAVRLFAPREAMKAGPQKWPLFLMGAAFLLLETKSIVQFSVLFGATWLVNPLVFGGVLVMVLAANAVVQRVGPSRLWMWYLALGISLIIGWAVPLADLASIANGMVRYLAAVLLVFLPIFFANIVFAGTFVESERPDTTFGWNLLGAMVGGIAEYSALAFGYRNLAIMVAILYALALLLSLRTRSS